MVSSDTGTHFRWKSDAKEEGVGIAVSNDVHYIRYLFFLFKNSVSFLSPQKILSKPPYFEEIKSWD